jgi:hypothetical protein
MWIAGGALLVTFLTLAFLSDDRKKIITNAADNVTAQACIASQRSASDCALILHGTGR